MSDETNDVKNNEKYHWMIQGYVYFDAMISL